MGSFCGYERLGRVIERMAGGIERFAGDIEHVRGVMIGWQDV